MKTTSILATLCGLSLLHAAEAKGAEGTTTTPARAYTGDVGQGDVGPKDEADVHRKSRRSEIPHNGFTVDVRGGAVGCTGQICKGGQSASPGGQVAGKTHLAGCTEHTAHCAARLRADTGRAARAVVFHQHAFDHLTIRQSPQPFDGLAVG